MQQAPDVRSTDDLMSANFCQVKSMGSLNSYHNDIELSSVLLFSVFNRAASFHSARRRQIAHTKSRSFRGFFPSLIFLLVNFCCPCTILLEKHGTNNEDGYQFVSHVHMVCHPKEHLSIDVGHQNCDLRQ